MPELPEVETVRRVLSSQIINLEIIDIDIRYQNIVSDDINYFISNVKNKIIFDISRLGKFLIFNLDKGNLISHLRMEGKYFYVPKGSMDNKHIHVIFYLSNGYMLCYQDVRKFGRMTYKENDELYNQEPLKNVGIDPIISQNINIEELFNKIKLRKTEIKSTLLDQSILAGLGNIYVDEVLFSSGINPHRLSNKITLDEVNKIVKESIRILNLAIENKGTTIKSYTSSLGVSGNYQFFLQVHTKNVCPHCKKVLIRDKIKGRTTYYCDSCQR